MEFLPGQLQHPAVIALLTEHHADMERISPPGSMHTLDINALQGDDISFWSVWSGEAIVGCCALKEITPLHAEMKSMRTHHDFRRQGIARLMVNHLIDTAIARGMSRLSLETGSQPEFAPARSLYRSIGFLTCPPFEGYWIDPNSTFMTMRLPG